MRITATVIWLSRHDMTEEQRIDLERILQYQFCEFEYVNCNLTFPARSVEAVEVITTLLTHTPANGQVILTGVFPAHIAGALARAYLFGWCRGAAESAAWSNQEMPVKINSPVFVPVSIPAPAGDGTNTTRPFVHSHWEQL